MLDQAQLALIRDELAIPVENLHAYAILHDKNRFYAR
jgi:hypothetical protein